MQSAKSVDELNIVRLNLIAALDQVTHSSWQVELQLQDRRVTVLCEALERYGVPHGLDNDVSAGLLAEFVAAGMPEDGRLTLSVTRLRKVCGLGPGGRYLSLLRESLNRLATTTYTVSEGGWQDERRRWTHAKFHFLTELEFTSAAAAGHFDERSLVSLQLAAKIVSSVRSGYTKPLDVEFMLSLSRPRARVLYRVLDAARQDELGVSGEPSDKLTRTLPELVALLKIPGSKPENVRRTLTGAHEELVRSGYLKAAEFTGRGQKMSVHYHFQPARPRVDPVAAARLMDYGVTPGSARDWASRHDGAWLRAQCDRFDGLVRSGVLVIKKSPAAALIDLLKRPDHYPYPKASSAVKPARATPTRGAPAPLLEPTAETRFQDLTVEDAADALVAYLRPLYGKRISLADLDLARGAVLAGQRTAAELADAAVSSAFRGEHEGFLTALRGVTPE